jgi:protein-disulfide isomerase
MTRKALLSVAVTVLLAAFVVAALVYHSKPEEQQPGKRPERPVAGDRPVLTDPAALVRFHSPSFGDPGAKVHIVEFFDPACETCREFYPFVKGLMDRNPGRIRVSLRYTPFHKGSDQVVRLLEASRRQGKYRETLETILASQPQWAINHVAQPHLALQAVERVGLEMARLRADMDSPELGKLIQQDMQDAVSLNVTKTPEFFVNGRPLARFGFDELQALVDDALREAYR